MIKKIKALFTRPGGSRTPPGPKLLDQRPTISTMTKVVLGWMEENPEALAEFKNTAEDELDGLYHFGLGMRIRNHFHLWQYPWEPVVGHDGVDCSPEHPDQVSARVIRALWHQLQSNPASST